MSKHITFRMVAYTDAAGKYSETAFRNGNEDNFYVDDDLSDDIPAHMSHDTPTTLSDCGLLMAVADGMGGMNAGEVASQIAVDTVAEYFAPGRITPKLAANVDARTKYLEDVIREADRRIKADAHSNSEHDGMGSTIILAWIVGDQLTISWCGDSRAYRFNPANGLEMLSEDHSYVQELVKRGVLTYEQTFAHPQGNIVMRSLGDPNKAAEPETRQFGLCNGDIILLCSDGLSGVLRDRPTFDDDNQLLPGDTIEDIMREHYDSLTQCREALWTAARRADWYDNVTAILCRIVDGAPKAAARQHETAKPVNPRHTAKQKLLRTGLAVVIVVVIGLIAFLFRENISRTVCGMFNGNDSIPTAAEHVDTMPPAAPHMQAPPRQAPPRRPPMPDAPRIDTLPADTLAAPAPADNELTPAQPLVPTNDTIVAL